jgi:hypothetical protein
VRTTTMSALTEAAAFDIQRRAARQFDGQAPLLFDGQASLLEDARGWGGF